MMHFDSNSRIKEVANSGALDHGERAVLYAAVGSSRVLVQRNRELSGIVLVSSLESLVEEIKVRSTSGRVDLEYAAHFTDVTGVEARHQAKLHRNASRPVECTVNQERFDESNHTGNVVLRVEALLWDRDIEEFDAECLLKDDRPNVRRDMDSWALDSIGVPLAFGVEVHDPSAG